MVFQLNSRRMPNRTSRRSGSDFLHKTDTATVSILRHLGIKISKRFPRWRNFWARCRGSLGDVLRLVGAGMRGISDGTMKPNTKDALGLPDRFPAVFSPLAPSERRRLDAGLLAEIHRLERCRKHIARIDKQVFLAGISCFESATALVLWLTEPAMGLGGKVPLQVMRSAKGRKAVVNLLGRIDHG